MQSVSASSEPPNSESFGRRRFVCGALTGALFATYISLVPFHFRAVSRASLADALVAGLDLTVTSRANFLANVVLFIPIAFMAAGSLRLSRRTSLKLPAIVGLCLALSVAIESLQVFVPGRTPSIVDVAAQTVGVCLGLAIWFVLGRHTERWLVQTSRGRQVGNGRSLLTWYVGLRTLALLLPLDVTVSLSNLVEKYRAGRIRIAPFQESTNLGLIQNFTIDAILAVPLGAFAAFACRGPRARRGVPAALAVSMMYVGVIEACQVFIMSRVADTTDVISGCVGAAIGVLATALLVPAADGNPQTGRYARALIAFGVVLAYISYNWSPFDFVLSREFVRQRFQTLLWVPFYSYYENPELKAALNFVSKMCIAAPVGIAAAIGLPRQPAGPFRRLQWFLCGVGALALFTIVEIGQLLLPERYPDITDVVTSMLAFAAAAWAWPSPDRAGRSSSHGRR